MPWNIYDTPRVRLVYIVSDEEQTIMAGEAVPDGGTFARVEVYDQPTVAEMREEIYHKRIVDTRVGGLSESSMQRDKVNMIPDHLVLSVWRSEGLEPSLELPPPITYHAKKSHLNPPAD